jgi:hypothetical protein
MCTFVLAKQVAEATLRGARAEAPQAIICSGISVLTRTASAWHLRQYLYFCTSKARKLSAVNALEDVADAHVGDILSLLALLVQE